MSTLDRLLSPVIVVAVTLCLSGCGTYMVAKTVTGAGSMVVGGAVGAVKMTGKVTGKAVGATVGTVAGLGRDEQDENW